MSSEASLTVRTWGNNMYVAFIDILGFQSLFEFSSHESSTPRDMGDTVFSLWTNCIPHPSQLTPYPRVLDFVQMSDSLVIYGSEPMDVIKLAGDIYGRALIWGVPIRGGLGYGFLNHAEIHSRPGTAINFFGSGLVDAHKAEECEKGSGMRPFVSRKFFEATRNQPYVTSNTEAGNTELKWWLYSGINLDHFKQKVHDWENKKYVRLWFKNKNLEDTKKVFIQALEDLKKNNV